MKVAQANKAFVAARKALAAQAAAGNDPRGDPEVNRKRAVAICEGHRRSREWKRDNGDSVRDEAWFRREVMPRLDAYPLKRHRRGDRVIARGVLTDPRRLTRSASATLGCNPRASRSRKSLSASRRTPQIETAVGFVCLNPVLVRPMHDSRLLHGRSERQAIVLRIQRMGHDAIVE